MSESKEIFKDFTGYEGMYQVSNLGNIKSFKCGKIKMLKKSFNSGGYLNVTFHKNKFSTVFFVHRLVAELFIPNPENKSQVNHINGIKTDNRAENLEWNSQSENIIHANSTGLSDSKLTEQDVLNIRISTDSNRVLAKKYNVSSPVISRIKSRKIWKHI